MFSVPQENVADKKREQTVNYQRLRAILKSDLLSAKKTLING